ncbi:hypothetical protein GUITHDRAFT_75022 [Guillardia theta CCMP2712]|uniref:Plasma membrane ATPase n=1 Tax=Guillardia theta (strain CCMP2712) TaxID=905079 RepID=L1IXM4_GUITC|nr:hypothetical protein GUITHDRAFT_75022 [Guillardia theta CCMP2712]EKX41028.1 hypothetical protein GUITHDRAFT_75022 [Guillardia theta CCMP2712]|eukprot:XP_005828008.1 hypothetical protein GUITHDRAFT_75022 [Guillardia theta CCMP2712]
MEVQRKRSKDAAREAAKEETKEEEEEGEKVDFTPAPKDGLTTHEAEELLKKWGKNELTEKTTPKWLILLRLLSGPMPIMLWIAALVELIIGNYPDMAILLFIQFTNAGISFYETTKAGDAVKVLKDSLKPVATAKRDGKWQDIDATLLVPGDLVLLAAGSAVPADCYVNEGVIEVDQSAMTGESLPVKFRRGEVCKLGSNVVRGEVEGTVESTGQNTFFGKTAQMLQSVGNESGSLQILLMRIMLILVVLSLTLCIIAFIYLIPQHQISQGEIVRQSLSFAVVVLVASIPLAIEIVTTTTLALGSRQLSARGAIVTRLGSIEEMAGMDMLCSDKTGTLTLNKMVIQEDCPTYSPGETYETVLFQAALAAKWKEPPRDALDTMVLKTSGQDLSKCDAYTQLEFTPFDPRTKRTEGKLQGPDGKIFRVTKGAPHVILNMCHNKDEIKPLVDAKVHELGTRGIRSLALARMDDEDGKWRMLGILTFLDPPRPDTKHTIEMCNKYGVYVKMITGDHLVIAKETARVLGMGSSIFGADGLPVLGEGGSVPDDLVEQYGTKICPADGFASVFPEHKYLIVETLRKAGFRVGMTGDGVNDAPALKRADVGIAVQGATDAARAAADIVLTGEGLSVVVDGIIVSREIFGRLKNFLLYRIAATLQLLIFFFIAVFSFPPYKYYKASGFPGTGNYSNVYMGVPRQTGYCPRGYAGPADSFLQSKGITLNATYFDHPEMFDTGCSIVLPICSGSGSTQTCVEWPEFFKLPVLLLMLITLLNDGSLISIGYDKVSPSTTPEQWNLTRLFVVSGLLALIATASSLLLLWAALDSNNPTGAFAGLGIPPMEYGKIITMLYLNVALADFLTLFSCRALDSPFWTVEPGKPMLFAIFCSLVISTFLASFWPESELDGLPVKGLALGTYKTMPLWVWIYSIIWWFIQDCIKIVVVRTMNKYNWFPDVKPDMEEWKRKGGIEDENNNYKV